MLAFDQDGNEIKPGLQSVDKQPKRSSMEIALSGMQRLMDDPDLRMSPEEAAGVMGSLWHESGGFKQMQELKPVAGRGGYGWAQWTGPRRRQFEEFARSNNLDPASDEANFQFLKHELTKTPEGRVLAPLKQAQSEAEASDTFTKVFERPGVPALSQRRRNARNIMLAFNGGGSVPEQTSDAGFKYFTDEDAAQVQFSEPNGMVEPQVTPPQPEPTLMDRGKQLMTDAGNAIKDVGYNIAMTPANKNPMNPGNLAAAAKAGGYGLAEGAAGVMQAGLEGTHRYLTGPVTNALGVPDPMLYSAQQYGLARRKMKAAGEAALPKTDNPTIAGVYSGVQSVAQNAFPLVAGLLTGQPEIALAGLSGAVAGQEYGKARDLGKGFEESLVYGGTQAGIEYLTERLPVGKLLNDIKADTPLWKTIGRQIATEIPGEEAATVLQSIEEKAVLNPEKTWAQLADELPGQIYQTAIATIVAAGAQSAIGHTVQKTADRIAESSKLQTLMADPEFRDIMANDVDPKLKGLEKGKAAKAIWAQRQALKGLADKPDDTTISSTGIPGDTNAQTTDVLNPQNEGREGDPLAAQTARQGGEGGISPQTNDAAPGPQVTDAQQITQASQVDGGLQSRGQVQGMPAGEGSQGVQSGGQEVRNPQAQEIAPEIRQAPDGQFQIVDTNTGTVISQHPTDVDAFEALDQLNADREIPTPTLEATNEGQIQEANPPGQEGLLSSSPILPAGGQVNTGTTVGEANATDTQGSAGAQVGGTAAGSPRVAGGEQRPAVPVGNAGGAGAGGQLDGAAQQPTATQGELGGQPDDARTLGPVLQNRNRSNPASVQQMQSIAGNPDYLRLSPSRNFAEGAPVVAGGTIPDQQMGRQETTVTAKGRRIPVRYAVVEADSVLASNRADGTVNSDYGNAEVIAPRAIAGNGRIAGLQKAYSQGSAQQYRADLESDDLHGIDQAIIRGMRSPVLVRVMPESELTQDIGDESNIAGGLSLSPVEQARNDATRLDIDGLSFDDGGDISRQSVVQFVRSMPESEQGGLLDQDGTPNRQAYDRLSAAVFHKAYDSDELVRLHTQAADPDSRLVMSSLAKLAPKFSRLKDKGTFDIRGWMTDAAKAIVNGRRRGLTLEQIANQQDLDIDPRAYDIVRLFADNPRSNKAVIEDLSDFSDFAYNEATRDTQDMFGETPRATESDLRKRLENYRERRRQEALAKRGGGKPVPQRAQKTAADPAGPDNPAQTATDQQDLLPAATDADRAESGRQALAEAQKEQQRKSNATQAPAADDGLFAQDNRQDELRFSLRPDEQQQRINRLNRGIDAHNRRYAGGDPGNARSRVELAAPEDVPAARRIEWKLASAIASVFKHNLIPVRGEAGGQLNFDGVVDPNGDPSSIFITVDSSSPISRVVAHELLHGLRLNAPKIYDNLVKTLRQLYEADALVEYVNGRNYGGELTDKNEEEWVADFVSNVIHSPDALVRVAFAMNRNKTGSGLNFLRRVQGLVERIKQGLAGTPLGANKIIARSDLQKAEDAVIDALAQYAAHQEKGTKPSGPLKFSNRTKEKTERIAEADYRVLRRDDNNLLPVEQKVFDDFLAGRPDGKELLQRLQEHRGTPWAQQAIEGIFVRQAIKEYAAGRTPEFQSSFDSKAVTKAREFVSRLGEEGIFAYLDSTNYVGDAAKPINNISSSFINCNPSKDCAKYCYATKGHYKFAPAVVKSEMVTMAIEMDPARVAQRAAAEYKATAEFANNKALRIFDKGDGNQAWIPFIRQMNVRGVRIHVFSKVPDFLRQVPDMNLKLLSVDNSNMEMADQNPDLPVAFVYSGGINQIDTLAKLAARGQIQVVLPVKLGQKLLDKQQVAILKQTVKGIGKYLCPIDAGVRNIGPNSDRTKWNCTKCDINGGLGCYHGKVTAAVLNSHEAKPKSGPEIAREILEVRAEIARFTAAGKSGNGGTGGPVADIRRDDARGVQSLLQKVDRLMGQLLEQYEPDAETRANLESDGGTDQEGADNEALSGDSGRADLKFSNRQKADDKAYLDAVNAGDMETAQRMVDAAAVKAGYFTAADYRMAHRAPNSQDDVSLDKVKDSGMVPDDYWTHPQWYQTQPEERESFYKVTDALRTAKQRMWVYRAVPKNVKDGAIRNGDWVTPSREYARIEGQSIPEGYRLIAQRVSLKDLYWDGNSIAELGFDDGKAYAYANTKNNRKLMDVVTRDDDGNIIPLSKRFNKRSDDLRFSNRPTQLVEEPLQDDLFRQQLDLYLDADPAGQSGPKTQAAKQSAVSAVESLRGSAGGVLGSRLADTYAARQRVSLVGHTLTSRTDLATLAQVYRDPRFETFRLFFVNQEGKIVSQVGLSSRLPASSAVFVGPDNQKFLDDLTKAAEKAGATGYYMLHNHPSTNPLPSNQDVGLTMFFNQKMSLTNHGHVVLDTNEFGIIKPDGAIKVIQKDFGQVSPHAANEFGLTTINSPTGLIETAKKLEVDKDAVTLIVTTAQHKVLGVTTIPSESIRNSSRSLRNMRIRKALKSMNGAKAFAVGTDRKTLLPLGNMVMDAIHVKEDGTYTSVNAELGGAYGMSDPFVVLGRNVPRVTADSSPEFDYLRDQTLLARGGGMGSEVMVSEPDTDLRFSNKRNVLGQPALATWTMPDDSKLERWTYLLQDKHIDTKRVVERLKTRVADAWDPYLKETLYHGRAAKDVDDFKVGEVRPLLQAMSTRGITIGELETFLWNRHAPEANAQIAKINPAYPDGGSGIKTQDALDYLANLPAGKRTDLEALAAQIDAITAGTRRLLVESGLETQETIDAWEATYSDYIPLQRETDDLAQKGMGTGQGFSTKGSASKRRTGSGRAVEDILANVMMQRERAITRTEKNKVGLALYGLAIQNPNPEFWYPVNPDAVKRPAKVAQELVNMGMLDTDLAGIIQEPTVAQINPRTGLVEYKINPLLRNRDNVLAVRIKGKDRFLFFSTENERAIRMAQALKNLDAPDMHGLMNAFRMVTRYISSINTQYNPIFGAVNLIRDTGAGLLNLSTTPIAGKQVEVMSHIMPALTGIYGDLRADRKGKPRKSSQWSQLWEEFQTVGGKTGYRDMYATAEDRAKALESELKKIQDGTVKRLTRGLFDWLSDYNETLENAVRLSAYKAGVDSGMTKERAAVMAKELTVNFNRKGQVASQAGSLYAFFNAAVQGTARLAETVKGPAGKKIVTGGLLMGVMQAVLLAAAGYDDDEPPEFVRERNFIIPLPNGKYINIPLPLGFHVIPNTSRVMVEAFMNPDDAGKKIAGLLGSYFEAFNPIGSAGWSVQTIAPTFADPLVALSENRDSFGKEIAKKDRTQTNPTPGFTRTKDTASWLSKHLAWGINAMTGGTDYVQGAVSPTPDQLDFLFGQATGGVGREILKLEQAASSWMSGEELPPYKYPLGVGRFFGDTKSQAADANRFYANITKLNEYENEIKGRAKDGKDVASFLRSNPLATLVPAGNQTERAVTELRSRKRKLLEQKAPKPTIQAIDQQIAARMKQLNDRVRMMAR